MNDIPWNDAAVLVRSTPETRADNSHGVEDEGSLREVVARLAGRRTLPGVLKIAFPDRRVSPYGYDASGIAMLLSTYRRHAEAERAAKEMTKV